MAAVRANSGRRERKSSFTSSIPLLLNRPKAGSNMTDQLIGVLNIIRMEGSGQTFIVKAILPDGKPKLVSTCTVLLVHFLVVCLFNCTVLLSVKWPIAPSRVR